MPNYNIKANRIFTSWRKWAWIFTIVVAFGGIKYPKLGLLVIPVILGLIGTSFFRGRFWCGNICAHGSLYDNILLKYSRNVRIPKFFRSKILMIAFFIWFGGKISYKLFMVFSKLEGMALLDKVGFIFVSSYIMVLLIGVPVGLLFTPRTWCRFCPMGTLQRLSYKLGKLLKVNKNTDKKISVLSKDLCHGCSKCSRVCPMQLAPYTEFDENNQFSSEKCIKCSTCVVNCPAKILSLDSLEEAKNKTTNVESHQCFIEKKEMKATIKKLRNLDPNVLEVTFELGRNKIDYTPGQFILVRINEKPMMNRAYSISGYDSNDNTLRVTIKKAPNGYGTHKIFEEFKEGKEIILEGPMGHELIVDKNAEKVVLVAGGIGITPFLPILRDLDKDKKHIKNVHLVYGVNKKDEILYAKEIAEVVEKHKSINFTPVVAFDKEYKGEKGFVTDVLGKMDLNNSKIYMCGPMPMVTATERLLKEKKFDEKNLFVETA